MPLRLVPDTNVLISALLWDGRARAIVEAARGSLVELYSSTALIAELEGKLVHPKFARRIAAAKATPAALLDEARSVLTVIETEILVPLAVRDPDDLAVLAVAFAARADVLVTQDKDLLDLRLAAEFAIMNVDEVFWTLGLTKP